MSDQSKSGSPIVHVRPMRPEDLISVIGIAAVVPTAPHWPPSEFSRMLQVIASEPARRGAWVGLAPGAGVQGFAMAIQTAGTAELEAVVTAPEHRRQGIGAALLAAVVAWSRTLGAERLLLEVRASNHDALRLYESRGFQRDGTRPGYYHNPDEDALLLSLLLHG